MKRISFIMLVAALLSMVSSCDYREYAPSDNYPDNTIYQPLANMGVIKVTTLEFEAPEFVPTEGFEPLYYLDAERNKIVFHMGIVQSGLEFKAGTARVKVNYSRVNTLIQNGELPSDVLFMPESAYSLPEKVSINNKSMANPYTFEVDANLFNTPEYWAKTVAVAVSIDSDDITVNKDLATVVFVLDSKAIFDL